MSLQNQNITTNKNNDDSNIKILMQKYNEVLTKYQETYQVYLESMKNNIETNASLSSNQSDKYSKELQKLNTMLISINQQIIIIINDSSSEYQEDVLLRRQKKQFLEQNYIILTNEKQKINRMLNQYNTLDSATENTELILTQNYYRYIALFIVAILLIFLLIKFSVSGDDQRGGGKIFKNEAIFLFTLMIVFLGLAKFFDNLNAYLLFSIIVISYVITKMKLINA